MRVVHAAMAALVSVGGSLLAPTAPVPQGAGETTFKGKKVQWTETPTTQLIASRDPVRLAGESLLIAGQSFPVAVSGSRLRVATVPNGSLSTTVSSGGIASLTWTDDSGRQVTALRFFVDGQGAWHYYAAHGWEFKVGGEVMRLIDANVDGKFDDFSSDGCTTYDSTIMLPLRKEFVLGSNRVRIASIAKDGSSLVASIDPIKVGPTELAMLARLNRWRSSNGFCSVDFNPTLSKNCSAHAAYLRLHNWTAFASANEQNMGPEGSSAEGASAAARSQICKEGAVVAIEGFLTSYYQRLALMSPALESIGLNEKPEDITVLDAFDGREKPWPMAEGWLCPATLPGPGARGITLSASLELPRVPVSDIASRGFPLMVLFGSKASVNEFKGKLFECKGTKLTEVHSLIADPWEFPWALGIVPASKLKAKTRYRAEFTFTVGGKAESKVIEFTTD